MRKKLKMIGESRHTRHNTSCHFVSKNHLISLPFFQRTTKHAFFRFIIYSFWCGVFVFFAMPSAWLLFWWYFATKLSHSKFIWSSHNFCVLPMCLYDFTLLLSFRVIRVARFFFRGKERSSALFRFLMSIL